MRNERLDILCANRLGEALYSDLFADPARPVNVARFIFLNPRATEFYRDWEAIAHDAVAILRTKAGRDPCDRRLSDLVGELSTRDLTLSYEALQPSADPGQRILIYTAEPSSPSQDVLNLLASWTAAQEAMPA